MMTDMKRQIRCGGLPVSVIVLAGGRGRRMNADKARLSVPGGTLLERVVSQVGPYFEEVLVSVSPGQEIEAGSKRSTNTKSPGIRIVEDEIPDQGPMAGILAGLKAAAHGVCAVVACDIPDVNVPYLRKLVRAAAEAEISVPVTPAGQFEPLFAVYTKAVVRRVEELLRAGERSLLPLFGRCRTVFLPLEDTNWLRNLNTRKDYEEFLISLRRPGRE
jgi:molybdopterin-guanine dinucleotide biosynthesis protein A